MFFVKKSKNFKKIAILLYIFHIISDFYAGFAFLLIEILAIPVRISA